jgi:hypothetical protein
MHSIIIHATHTRLLLFTPMQDMHVEELLLGAPAANVTIVSGQIADPFVLLRLSNGQVH